MDLDSVDIDERLQPLIKRLNRMGFETSGCCQGADFTNYDDYREYWDRTKGIMRRLMFSFLITELYLKLSQI